MPGTSRCENWCHGAHAGSCLLPTSVHGGACSNCSFCAAHNETAYATIVYGTGAPGLFSACSARVLGEALKSIDPSRHRVVIVDDTEPQPIRQLLTDGGLWTTIETERLDSAGRKTPLWTLPFRRVFFMDADVFPIQGVGEGPAAAERRARRLNDLWRNHGRVVATHDGAGGNAKRRCLNSGVLMIEPGPRLVRKIDQMVSIRREWQASGHEQEDNQFPAGHVFERCPFGYDQPPINAALGAEWSSFHVKSSHGMLVLAPLLGRYCLQGGESGPGVRAFYQRHTVYQAWGRSTPLSRLDSSAIDLGDCRAVHNEYTREWWTIFNRTMTAPQQKMCLRGF